MKYPVSTPEFDPAVSIEAAGEATSGRVEVVIEESPAGSSTAGRFDDGDYAMVTTELETDDSQAGADEVEVRKVGDRYFATISSMGGVDESSSSNTTPEWFETPAPTPLDSSSGEAEMLTDPMAVWLSALTEASSDPTVVPELYSGCPE